MQDKLTAGAERFIRAVTEFIFVEDQPEQADVILIPGSRKISHTLRAAELYRAGYAPYVLPSGKYGVALGAFLPLKEPLCSEYPGAFESEWQLHQAVLLKQGVPEAAILREDQATYTWENAQFSRDVLNNAGIAHYTGADSFVQSGAFTTCGVNYTELGAKVGDMAFDILAGGAIGEFVVMDGGIITVNTNAAQACGIDYSVFNSMANTINAITVD